MIEILKAVLQKDDIRALLTALEPYEPGDGNTVFKDCILDTLDFRRLAYHPIVLDRVAELLQGIPEPYYSHLTTIGSGGTAMTSNWHYDTRPPEGMGVKAHFYLTDVQCLADGAMQVQVGSSVVNVLADAGDVVLSRPDVYHRSTRNFSRRTRKTVFISYKVKLA